MEHTNVGGKLLGGQEQSGIMARRSDSWSNKDTQGSRLTKTYKHGITFGQISPLNCVSPYKSRSTLGMN